MVSSSDSPLPPALTPDQIASFNEDRGPAVVGVASTFVGLCTIVVFLRFYARYSRRMGFGLDDWLAAGALLFLVLYCVTCIISGPYGMGRHSWAADPTKIWRLLQIALFNALIYFTVHWFIKMSLLSFYGRVFTLRIAWFKYSVIAVATYTTAWFISSFFAGLFQCFPPAFFWEQYNPALQNEAPTGSCGASNAPLVIATSALNSVGDVLVFSLPIAMLSQLQLNRTKKISLIAVFATGAFAIAAGIVRLTQTLKATRLGADTTWIIVDIYMWTAIEAGVGLICACLPIIGPLFDFSKWKRTQESGHSSRSQKSQPKGNFFGHSHSNTSKRNHPSSATPFAGHHDSVSLEELELESQSAQRALGTDRHTVESLLYHRATQSNHSFSFDAYSVPGTGTGTQPQGQV